MAWFDGLVAGARRRGGQSLEHARQVVGGADHHVTDGPDAEAKQSVAGCLILLVDTEAEAIEIAKLCPGLPCGITIEIRRLMQRCSASLQVKGTSDTHTQPPS
jgi:hypothetical protein